MAKNTATALKASTAPAAIIAKLPVTKTAAATKAPAKAPAAKLSLAAKAFNPAASKTMNIRLMMAADPALSWEDLKAELEAAGYDGKRGEKIVEATIKTIRADVLATLQACQAAGRWNGPAIKSR